MGTAITNGLTVSITNTPQAKDDLFSGTSLSEDNLGTVTLDVMANDLGGAAKTLYSLDDGSNSLTDLLNKDTARAEGLSSDFSAHGAHLWITADGKVSYDASTLDAGFKLQLQQLGAGESLTDSFTYAIRLGNGTLSWGTATVQIAGTNDGPVAVADQAAAVEDTNNPAHPNPVSGNVLSNDTDVDIHDTHSVTAVNGNGAKVGVDVEGTYGTLHLNADGSYTYTLDNGKANVQALAQGEAAEEHFSYTNGDNHGGSSNGTLTISITGTNDGPQVNGALTASGVEGYSPYSLNLLAGASDADHGETASLSISNVSYSVDDGPSSGTAPAGLSLTGASLAVDPTDSAFNSLAVGEHTTITVSYDVVDIHGASVSQTETITIAGTNDGPQVTAALTANAAEGDSGFNLNLLAGASDADHGETASLSVANVSYSVNGGSSSGTAPAGLSLTGASLAVNPADSAFNSLAVGEHTTIVVSYDVVDVHGASVSQSETITIAGTNDGPSVSAALSSNVDEGNASYSLNLLQGASDPDHGETASLSISNVSYSVDGGATSSTAPAGLSLTGASLTVDPTDPAFNSLAVGEHTTIVVSYDVVDVHGASVSQSETITIAGTNDGPQVTAALTSNVAEGDASYSLNLLAGASDADHGETASLSVANVSYSIDGGPSSGTAPAGLSLTGASLAVDPSDPAFNALAVGEHTTITISYDVVDLHGASVSQSETITITGTNDEPQVTAALTSNVAEGDASYSLNLLAGASDADHGETASLSVANVSYSVDGGPNSGTAPAGLSLTGASLAVDPANPAFNSLAVGEQTTITVSYDVVDVHGASVSQSETITIAGTNDGPQVTAALSSNVDEGNASYSLNLLAGASDADHGETATLSVSNVRYSVDGGPSSGTAPAGLSLTGASLAVDPTDPAFNSLAISEHTTITVSYDVVDVHGASVAQTETITIAGTNDGPSVSAALSSNVDEGDASYSLNLLAGASDADHGETASLSISNVSYSVDGGPSSGTAPAGLSLTGASLAVDPSDPAFNALAVGETTTITVSYDVVDVHGASVSQSETITITGTNDGPQVTAALTSNVAEGDASYSLNLLAGASDADHGETASLSISNVSYSVDGGPSSGTAPAGLSLTGASLAVDPSDPAFNALAVGEHTTIVVSYDVVDVHGASVSQSETITVAGTNDGPQVTAALTSNAAEGDSSFNLNLLAGASDADHGETASLSISNVSYSINGGPSSSTAPAGLSLTGASLAVDPTDPAFNSLAVGEHTTIVVSYDVVDVHGASVSQSETITIAGTNDGPQVTAVLASNAAEGDSGFNLNLLAGASDADHGETASLSINNVSYSINGGPSSSTAPAGLSLAGASLAVDPTDPAFNSLAVGEHTTITISYDVVDVHGTSVSQTETITIAGTNDGPVNVVPAAQSVNEDASLVFSSGNGNRISIGDADNGSHTVTLTATHGSLSLNGTTGLSFSQGDGSGDASMTFSGSDAAINAALNGMSFLGDTNYNGAATLTLQTGDGLASDSDTVNLTVNGVNDGPLLAVPAAQTVNQNTALSLGGIGVSDVDDADNGVSGDLLVQVSLSVGHGSLALANTTGLSGDLSGSDGTLQITGTLNNVNAALTGLSYQGSLNYSGSDALAISASDLGHDGSGGALTSSGSVNINVVATNHAPTDISLAATEPSGGNNLPGAGTVLGTFSSTDPDAGDSFSYSLLAGSSAGFTVGAISGTLTATSALSQSSTYTLNVQTTDSHGASYSETLNIITGSNQQGQITGNDTLPGSGAGSPILVGDDVLYGSGGNDLIFGGSGNDSLFGQGGDDMLQGGAGNDLLSGANGADIFRWVSGDNGAAGSPAVDKITNFSTATGGGNNDKLDLADLLQGEHANAGSLDAFLDFHVSGGNTTIDVRASSGGSITQQIVLQGVDLSNGGTLTSDAQIITSLLGDQKLVVDA